MQAGPAMALCPSFSTYSSGTMADIAARVVEELRNEPHPDTANLFPWPHSEPHPDPSVLHSRKTEHPLADEEDDFEFAFVTNWSPISADEIFSNGQIKPVYPVFNTELFLGRNGIDVGAKIRDGDSNPKPKKTGRTPLRKLMTEERETTTSCSSSEADDLDSVPAGAYCVWTPNKTPEGGKKSNSTGSSKRWKLKDLLHRSNSDGGKETFVAGESVSARYVKSRTVREGGKRKSYLPYKQDLVGLLANVNGLSRNLHPF